MRKKAQITFLTAIVFALIAAPVAPASAKTSWPVWEGQTLYFYGRVSASGTGIRSQSASYTNEVKILSLNGDECSLKARMTIQGGGGEFSSTQTGNYEVCCDPDTPVKSGQLPLIFSSACKGRASEFFQATVDGLNENFAGMGLQKHTKTITNTKLEYHAWLSQTERDTWGFERTYDTKADLKITYGFQGIMDTLELTVRTSSGGSSVTLKLTEYRDAYIAAIAIPIVASVVGVIIAGVFVYRRRKREVKELEEINSPGEGTGESSEPSEPSELPDPV